MVKNEIYAVNFDDTSYPEIILWARGAIILLQNVESRLKLVEVSNALQFLLDFFSKGRHAFSFSLLCLLSVKMQRDLCALSTFVSIYQYIFFLKKSTAAEGFNCFQCSVENQCYMNSFTFKRVINFICKAAKIDVSGWFYTLVSQSNFFSPLSNVEQLCVYFQEQIPDMKSDW